MGIFDQKLLIHLTYLGGHPDLPNQHQVAVGEKDGNIILYGGLLSNKELLSVPKEDITGITLQRASQRSVGKAAAGAIIGGVLTGGIGAIAGAALGARKKDDSLIFMTVKYHDMEVEMIFDGVTKKDDVTKKYSKFMSLIKK